MDLLRRAVSRVLYSLLAVAVVVVVGGVALWWLGGTEYGFGDAVFFALISATTVGFSELPHLGEHAGGRLVTAVVIVAGVASIATLQSTLTALLVEGAIGRAFRRRRMQDKVAALKDHLVVAGCGRTGRYLIEELAAVHTRFVVIDRDEAAIQKLDAELGGRLLWVNGDATDDHTLLEARVPAAAGIVSALTDDRDNLFVTLSARSLAPRARIVAKVVEIENEPKIRKAGADATVSPHRIGGLRLASELVRPRVTEFLDEMLRASGSLRFEEVALPESPEFVGRTLRDLPIRNRTNLLVVALHEPEGAGWIYNPPPDHRMRSGTHLVVMGESASVIKLRDLFAEMTGRPSIM